MIARFTSRIATAFLLSIAMPLSAQAAVGDRLMAAAFSTGSKDAALAVVNASLAEIAAALKRDPADRDLRLQQAIGLGYRAKLTRSIGDAKAARDQFTALAREDPNDPQPLIALASWHIETVADVGGLVAGALLGAKREDGLGYMLRAVRAGGGRALFTGFAALLNARARPSDVADTRKLAEAAAKGAAPTPLDREMQKRAARLLPALQAGDGKAAAKLAATLLPLGAVQ